MTDAVVVGGGVNGLACAVQLARSGRKVVVLEARDALGGLSGRRAFADGFAVPGIRHSTQGLRMPMVQALGLTAHGLIRHGQAPAVLTVEADGPGLLLPGSVADAQGEIAQRSKKDADAYGQMHAFMQRVRRVMEPLLNTSPPPLLPRGVGDALDVALLGVRLRGLGARDMVELLRALPMCVADLVREWFETEIVSATLAMPAVLGDFVGPWSPGTGAMFLLERALEGPGVKGGPAAVVDALVKAAQAHQVTLRTSTRVTGFRIKDGRVAGVTLDGGEQLDAPVVVAACHPKHALLELLAPLTMPMHATEAARTMRCRGTVAKVHLGLKSPVTWKSRPQMQPQHVQVGAHLDELERAFDAVKYRQMATQPVLDITVPTVEDPTLASGDRQVLSIMVSGVPANLEGGWTDQARQQLLERTLAVLELHAPGVGALVEAHEVLSPADLEQQYGAVGGSLHHVERALDQMVLMRPARPFAQGRTPVPGLLLGSSGCHPGPGVTLAPGMLAARAAADPR